MKDNMDALVVIDLTYQLQQKLEAMNDEEFAEYMKGKALRINGKVCVLDVDLLSTKAKPQ